MPTRYRIFFRNGGRDILGRQDFDALDDIHAVTTAKVLWEACSDIASGYEVFDGTRYVHSQNPAQRVAITWNELVQCGQESLVDLETVLKESRWAVARSRRLLMQLAHIKSLRF